MNFKTSLKLAIPFIAAILMISIITFFANKADESRLKCEIVDPYSKAVVYYPNGEYEEINILKCIKYSDGDLQIITKDGENYLFNSTNVKIK